jgi:peptide/nickel transport system ATP-binding protein
MDIPVPLLSIESLGVEFRTRGGTVHALEDISFAVAKGETIGVVGESGSGKSVLFYAVLGILDAAGRITGGRAVFGGLDLVRASAPELEEIRGREAAMIFQNPRVALNPIRKVGHQIEDVLARHTSTPSAELRQRAIEALASVRIPDPERRYHAYPFELSGGLCQRIMIAIALACSPSLLVADEPTTGLDPRSRQAIWALVTTFKDAGIATLLTTQYLEEADALSDRIVVVDHGSIVAHGTADELKERTGGTVCEIVPRDPADVDAVAAALGSLLPESSRAAITPESDRVSVPAPEGPATLSAALARLDSANIVLADIALRRPSASRLNASDTRKISTPGKAASSGWV